MKHIVHDAPALPRPLAFINGEMASLRKRRSLSPLDRFDVVAEFNRRGTDMVRASFAQMGDARALTGATQELERVLFREDLYDDLFSSAPSAQAVFEGAHELLHAMYHRGEALKPFIAGGDNEVSKFLPEDQRAETQANWGARALLLPQEPLIWRIQDAEIAARFNVPEIEVLRRRHEINDLIRQATAKADISAAATAAIALLSGKTKPRRPTAADRARAIQVAIDNAWEMLEISPGEDPAEFRICKGYRIAKSHYLKPNPPSQLGWHFKLGRIVPYMCE